MAAIIYLDAVRGARHHAVRSVPVAQRVIVAHDIPGRIRFGARLLKSNSTAQTVCAHIRALEGVATVRANLVTGSLVVEYDGTGLVRERIFAALRELGFHLGAEKLAQAPAHPSQSSDTTMVGVIVKQIAWKLIEDVVFTALVGVPI